MNGRSRPAAAIAVAAALVAVAALVVFYPGRGDDSLSLGELRSRGVTYLEDERVFVVAHGDDVLALSADSPGRDARLLYCPSTETFLGPHGEGFNVRGQYWGGPAPRDMDVYPVDVDGDSVSVDLSERVVAPGRTRQPSPEPGFGDEICRSEEGEPGYALPPGS